MATLNLGKLKFNWRGNWATETAYAVDDVVFDNGTSWIVTTAVAATNTTRPEASDDFEVMAPGFNFRGDFDDTADYFENDVVTHDSAIFLATADNDPAAGNEPNTSPLNSSWDEIVPAPENNVLTTIGDLLYRDNTGANARLPIGAEGAGLTVQQDPRESIPSRAIRYDEPDNNHGRARDQNDQADASTTFGSTDNNGVIFCTRGLTYTITVEVASSTRNYNLHTDASGEATNLLGTDHAGSANANVTNGSGTLNFQPDASTPDDVYIRDHNSSGRNVRIRVVDMALTPSWGDAPTEDSLVLDDTDGTNTFTIATANMSANRTWTLPTTAPSANQIIQFATDGTISYTDQPSGWFDGHAILRYNIGNNNTTTGGTLTAGTWTTRNLNEIFENDGSVVSSLSSNQWILNNTDDSTRKYLIQWDGNTAYVNANATRLFNVTSGTVEGMGGVSYASVPYWADMRGCQGHIDITIPANTSRSYRIEHICQTSYNTYGQGIGSGSTARNWGDGIHIFVNIWRYAN
jgi:hypothetical protein